MTINSLSNFCVSVTTTKPSEQAVKFAQEIIGGWALGDAPPAMTLSDIRKLTRIVALGMDRFREIS